MTKEELKNGLAIVERLLNNHEFVTDIDIDEAFNSDNYDFDEAYKYLNDNGIFSEYDKHKKEYIYYKKI